MKYFAFYESYANAAEKMPAKERADFLRALYRYFFYGEIPKLKGYAEAVFDVTKQQLDSNAESYQAKKRGGQPGNQNAKRQNESENEYQNESKNEYQNESKNEYQNESKNEYQNESKNEYQNESKNEYQNESKTNLYNIKKNNINLNNINKRESKREKRAAFSPPSLDEVTQYCLERKNGINPQAFIDFYTAKGWMIGKEKMKDWKAAIRTWEARNKDAPKTQATVAATSVQKNKFVNFPQREWDFDAIMKAEEERRDRKTEEEKEGVQECKY